MPAYKREINGREEFSDGEFWFDERNVCRHCAAKREASGAPYQWADTMTSFGAYAGRYCGACWPLSGYRDATASAEWSQDDCGEVMYEDQY